MTDSSTPTLERVLARKAELELSSLEIERRCGVSPARLSSYRADRTTPKPDTLAALWEAVQAPAPTPDDRMWTWLTTALHSAGLTPEGASALSDEELLGLDGIGWVCLRLIRKRCAAAEDRTISELLASLGRLFSTKADLDAKKRYLWQNVESGRLWSLLADAEARYAALPKSSEGAP